MTIHGLRIYPQTVTMLPGDGAPIFVHGRLSADRSDCDYLFLPLVPSWQGHVIVQEFAVWIGEDGEIVDPLPALRAAHGSDLVAADVATQLLMLRAEGFSRWSRTVSGFEGALLSVFRDPPPFATIPALFWGPEARLRSDSWPPGLRSIVQAWDGIFWQLFTTEPNEIDVVIRAHRDDPRLAMYLVDLDREFPDPSHDELRPVT